MSIPKTKKLQEEEANAASSTTSALINSALQAGNTGPVKIREVACCNDFVAILQFQVETNITLVNSDDSFKNEGLVVGVGPGISDGNGGRLKPCVDVGDVVMFGTRNIAAVVDSSSEPYKDKKVVIVSERNILCRLNKKIEYVKV